MRSPKIFLVPAIFIVIPAALWLTLRPSLAESAADECRAKPGPAAPAGSHWFYRINRPDGRHCWYLGQEGTKSRSAALDESHAPAHSPKPRHARGEAAAPTPVQTTSSQTTSAQAAAAPAPATPLAPGASTAPWDSDNASVPDFAVRWRVVPLASALNARGPDRMMSDAKDRVATDRPQARQPTPSTAAKGAELQRTPSEAAFIPTMLTGTLALLLLLLGAISKLARYLNTGKPWHTAAGWLEANHQPRVDRAEKAGPRAEPAKEPTGLRSRRATRTDAAHLKADLQQLLRDLRRAEAESEPPRKFEPDANHQLRLILGKFASRRSRLQIFNGEHELGTTEHQSDLASPGAHPLLRSRSAA
jgi:hypothetical protein